MEFLWELNVGLGSSTYYSDSLGFELIRITYRSVSRTETLTSISIFVVPDVYLLIIEEKKNVSAP